MAINFPIYISLIPVVITAIGLIIGIIIIVFLSRLGYIVVVIACLFGLVMIPTLFLDTVEISDTSIGHTTGIWFIPRKYGLIFKEVSHINIQLEPDRNNRNKEIWYFYYKKGGNERVDPGDLWIMGRSHIIEACTKNSIIVNDMSGPR